YDFGFKVHQISHFLLFINFIIKNDTKIKSTPLIINIVLKLLLNEIIDEVNILPVAAAIKVIEFRSTNTSENSFDDVLSLNKFKVFNLYIVKKKPSTTKEKILAPKLSIESKKYENAIKIIGINTYIF